MKYTTINFTTDLGSKWGKIAYGLTDEIPRIYNKVKRRRRLLCMMTDNQLYKKGVLCHHHRVFAAWVFFGGRGNAIGQQMTRST